MTYFNFLLAFVLSNCKLLGRDKNVTFYIGLKMLFLSEREKKARGGGLKTQLAYNALTLDDRFSFFHID